MQRKAVRRPVLSGIAMLTALAAGVTGLTGCTDGSGIGSTSDAKAGDSSAAPAQPGKYRSLPAPCKAIDAKRLKAMIPAAESLTEEQREKLYAGVADASYDGDRRVGCRWNSQTPEETLLLSVGFERVVSYDRATTSDDDKARQVFVRRLTEAHLPFPGPTGSPTPGSSTAPAPNSPIAPPATGNPAPSIPPSGTPSAPGASPSGTPGGTPSGSPSGSPSPTAPPELGSRVLEGLGSEAYVEDKLGNPDATAARARTVRLVFRTSNVIVTIEYSVQPALPAVVPPSWETQDSVRQLAQALVERFND
ncbi:DUF3558 domain-containing protein [Streptomyces sp. NBC_01426]|uniref:DUF3558 domain-containing protein n=1 Tax=Streptomyces sp. NBC_01426 TaxID=2975866 RepID=UPI002E34E99B|nr:DUF3558 domain-containing protein [Streptomyces sp. NBC_01426]